jgi:hypothetical protein
MMELCSCGIVSKQENDGVARIYRLVRKQESEIAKGELMNCASCKSEGGSMKVSTRNNAIMMR